jgi:hypothetical protein
MTCEMIIPGTGFICTGTGEWRPMRAVCPFCSMTGTQTRPCVAADVYGGFCGQDYICASCGFRWNSDERPRIKPLGPREWHEAQKRAAFAREIIEASARC